MIMIPNIWIKLTGKIKAVFKTNGYGSNRFTVHGHAAKAAHAKQVHGHGRNGLAQDYSPHDRSKPRGNLADI
jgi:hypothetical protein